MTTGAPVLNATCLLAATEVAGFTESFDCHVAIDQPTYTVVGSRETRVNRGKEAWMIDMTFVDGQAASEAQGVLFPLIGTIVAFTLRKDDGAISASNPEYTGMVLLGGAWSVLPAPADGGVPKITCSFQVDGAAAKAIV